MEAKQVVPDEALGHSGPHYCTYLLHCIISQSMSSSRLVQQRAAEHQQVLQLVDCCNRVLFCDAFDCMLCRYLGCWRFYQSQEGDADWSCS